jgi:hypothetical protein
MYNCRQNHGKREIRKLFWRVNLDDYMVYGLRPCSGHLAVSEVFPLWLTRLGHMLSWRQIDPQQEAIGFLEKDKWL